MVTLHTATTDDLSPAFLGRIRALLEGAFGDDFTNEDWDHTIGGVHVWLMDADQLISHASVVPRTFVCSGVTLEAGYVEAVSTARPHRGKGYGATVMRRAGDEIRDRYALGALSTGIHAFYERLGWERWRGPTFVDGPRGRERTSDEDDAVMILRTPRSPQLDLHGEIVCDWRSGDVW